MDKINLIVTGAQGQLGKKLQDLWPASQLNSRIDFTALSRDELDITNADTVSSGLSRLDANIIVNTAAYTAVDQAETDSDKAHEINELGVLNLASWAAENNAWLIQLSTDFVFDGTATKPYTPENQPSPIGVYGHSKLAGENQIHQLLPDVATIIRTSWLYSEHGNNFVKTMLRLMMDKSELSVVSDQIGSPTSAHSLARIIFAMIHASIGDSTQRFRGLYHWSDGGEISWFNFAQAIQRQGLEQGILTEAIPLKPIDTSEYPTAAKRPAYSVLDRSKILAEIDFPATAWQQELSEVITALS